MKTKQEIISEFKINEKDTGSSAVQIAILTERILHLTEHLKANPKDNHTRTGLVKLVSQRKNLLNYLKNKDLEAFKALKQKLGLR